MLVTALQRPAGACIWYYGTDLHGHEKAVMYDSPDAYVRYLARKHFSHDQLLLKKQELEQQLADGGGFQVKSDLAATLIYLGDYSLAISILEPLASQHREEYALASNLGTAYELAGDVEKANQWIKEGLRRDPDGHFGSEWLHALILDAKIELKLDPTWLNENSVTGLDFGTALEPKPSDEYKRIARILKWEEGEKRFGQSLQATIQKSLEYQLEERMGFVPPPDPIVGDLLFDLANVLALEATVEIAVPVYELAIQYKAPRAELARKRIDHFTQISNSRSKSDDRGVLAWILRLPGICLSTPLLLVALIYFLIRRHRKMPVEPEASAGPSLFSN